MTDGVGVVRATVVTVMALVLLRLILGAVTPLAFDEAYYWTWSKHLAGGYYDHPPMVAVMIWLGTQIAGDTVLGVRLISILLALPMSYALFRATDSLFHDKRIAASATILLNATLMAAVGTIIVTPDAPLLVASCFVMFGLAKVMESGRGEWWLAVGLAVGAALLSKYTALFFGVVILVWLVLVPELRRWLASPWLYAGGAVALLVFSPVIMWNADHQWVSFIKQLGRAKVEGLTLKYFGEMLPTQIGFATPFVFILGVTGLWLLARRRPLSAASALVMSSFWIVFLYFCWHSLHSRVEANWLAPVYPAFAVAAAVAAHEPDWRPTNQRTVNFCRRFALPVGVLLLLLLMIQTNTGLFTGFRRDATMRSIGVGWTDLAREIELIRARSGAQCVVVADYGTTSWLMFYLPKGTCVVQLGHRYRWASEPDPALLRGRLLLVGNRNDGVVAPENYRRTERLAVLPRLRSGVTMETYEIDLLDGPLKDPLDRTPPPELAP